MPTLPDRTVRRLCPSKQMITGWLCAQLGAAAWGQVAPPQGHCPDGQTIDGMHRAGTSQGCLVVQPYQPKDVGIEDVLVVFLHGDNGGRLVIDPDKGSAHRIANHAGVATLLFQRPGYRSELGTSDGFTTANDDDYTAGNTDIIAAALESVKRSAPGKKLLLVGHSGGSAMTALVASRYPAAADAYLVVACPCDVGPWRAWRRSSAGKTGHWGRSLSPVDEASRIPAGTRVQLMVGDRDENTLPKFSEEYVAALRQGGNPGGLIRVPNATHGSITRSDEFFATIREMAKGLSHTARTASGQ